MASLRYRVEHLEHVVSSRRDTIQEAREAIDKLEVLLGHLGLEIARVPRDAWKPRKRWRVVDTAEQAEAGCSEKEPQQPPPSDNEDDLLGWVLEAIDHPDNLAKLPAIAKELQQRSGEEWAMGALLLRAHRALAMKRLKEALP